MKNNKKVTYSPKTNTIYSGQRIVKSFGGVPIGLQAAMPMCNCGKEPITLSSKGYLCSSCFADSLKEEE